MTETKDVNLGKVTAYAYAVSAGYNGTEEDFAQALCRAANAAELLEAALNRFTNEIIPAAVQAVQAEGQAQSAAVQAKGAEIIQQLETFQGGQ